MTDPRVQKLAKLLVEYCVEVKPDDKVAIFGHVVALPLVREVYREVIRAGGHPHIGLDDDILSEIFFKESNDKQLQFISEPRRIVMETYDCQIGLWGGSNTRFISNVDPGRMQKVQKARQPLMDIHMKRSAAGELRWTGTMFPTPAYAQEADMSLSEYEDFVYGACFVDKDDPVAEWQKVRAEQQRLIDWLAGKKEVVVKGPHVDLKLSIAERNFINSAGRKNMPSGEIFTSPIEDSVNGWIRFTYPAIYGGREVSGVELFFEEGKVVKATAQKNEDYLLSVLDTDEGARYLGEFAIGTNKGITKFTKSILFDEKIGGTIHVALGAGFPEANGQNKSGIHWDIVCDMRDGGQIFVDDELFYESGRFLLPL